MSTQPPLLKTSELATALGTSNSFIYKMTVEDKNFPHYRYGATRRYDLSQVLEYLGKNIKKEA